jgi:allophanate hydrolase
MVSKWQPLAELVLIAVAGAHLEGQPLNHQLTDSGGQLVERTATAPCYRMFALDTEPPKPGLVRVEAKDPSARGLEVEVWALEPAAFAAFVDAIPAPLVIGRVLLADGRDVAGFLCEPISIGGATDISSFGGWRAYRAATATPP